MAFFDSYRKRVTAREIPVVIFERVADQGRPISATTGGGI